MFYGLGFLSSLCCVCATCCSCCAASDHNTRKKSRANNPNYYDLSGPPAVTQPPTYQAQPVVIHNHYEYDNSGQYRGHSKPEPNITIGYERHNPDGTTEIITQPFPPQPTNAPTSGGAPGLFGHGGYTSLGNTNNSTNNNGAWYNGSKSATGKNPFDNTIEMSAYPMGDTRAGNYNNKLDRSGEAYPGSSEAGSQNVFGYEKAQPRRNN